MTRVSLHSHRLLACVVACAAAATGFHSAQQELQDPLVIEARFHHLGDSPAPEWTEASAQPEGLRLDLEFQASANTTEFTLSVVQRHVNDRWGIELNGREFAVLEAHGGQKEFFYPVPPGALADGFNRLSFVPSTSTDDITLGKIRLHPGGLRQVLRLHPVRIRVSDRRDGRPLPARITIVAADGTRPELYFPADDHTAVRPGLAYTDRGEARFEAPAGHYKVYATRGMEWSLGQAEIEVGPGGAAMASLNLSKEVETPGYVAADTHIHTYTFSGHGDSTVEERMVTLAGEGVELAIATDHNHHTDYRPVQQKMGLGGLFTAVTGNEVTTSNGHFNAFPFHPESQIPGYEESDWVKLVAGIRERGARVVILNHPRWPALDTGPYGVFHLDRSSGERHAGPAFTFDAMELANSTDMKADPLYLCHDWFALLNHGERITAVGSSDSHTVGDPVGQGRTYVRSEAADPGAIDVDAVCDAFLDGDSTVSLGIYAHAEVQGGNTSGALVPVRSSRLQVRLRVAAPSWIRPDRVRIFVNGEVAADQPVAAAAGRPCDEQLVISVPAPPQDAWLVCLVTGPGVEGPWWPTMQPYTLAATNPVYLDVDGDGAWSSPRATAEALIAKHGAAPARLLPVLRRFDRAVAVQAASLARARYLEEARLRLRGWSEAEGRHREALEEYLRGLPGAGQGAPGAEGR